MSNSKSHNYPFSINDTAYVINDSLTIRQGRVTSIPHDEITTYGVYMLDNSSIENFSFSQMFGLRGEAQIHIQQFLVTPTPSISVSATPNPSRTPKASVTPTPTPSSSNPNFPNLFNNLTWQTTNGTVSVKGESNLTTFKSLNTGDQQVSFATILNLVAGEYYSLKLKFNQGTCQNANIDVVAILGDNGGGGTQALSNVTFSLGGGGDTGTSDVINQNINTSGLFNSEIYVPDNAIAVGLLITMFADSNGVKYAPLNYDCSIDLISLKKFIPYGQPTTSPIVSATPTPTPSPSVAAPHLFNFFSRLTRFAAPDPTFMNLPIQNLSYMKQTIDDKIYIGTNDGGYQAPDFHNLTLFRLNSDGSYDSTYPEKVTTAPSYAGTANLAITYINQTADNKIYVTGHFDNIDGHPSVSVGRLNSDGSVDTSFDDIGLTYHGGISFTGITQTIDGKIYLSGNWYDTVQRMGVMRLNSDGTLDNTFTPLTFNFDTNYPLYTTQTADGKIYVYGYYQSVNTTGTPAYNGICRLNSDGTFDDTFTNLNTRFNTYSKLTQTADDKIYLTGNLVSDDGNLSIGIRRLNSDGTADTTTDESFNTLRDNSPAIAAIWQTIDGYIYLGGLMGAGNNWEYFKRLNSDGSVDTGFQDLDIYSEVKDIVQTSDEKIYLVGGTFTEAPNPSLALINSTGAITSRPSVDQNYNITLVDDIDGKILFSNQYETDSHFGVGMLNFDGTIDTDFTEVNCNDYISAGLRSNDGKLYVTGSFTVIDGNNYTHLSRFNSSNVVDTTFVNLGLDANVVNDICQTADGKIYFVGDFTTVGGDPHTYVARLNSDGTYDSTFADIGIVGGGFANCYSVTQTADGKIYLAGSMSAGGYTNLIRLNSDGTLDTTFVDLALDSYDVAVVHQLSTGKIMISGAFTTVGGHTYNTIARLNSDGTVDTTFADLVLSVDLNEGASKFIELSTGKVMMIGMFSGRSGTGGPTGNYFILARLNIDGTVDNTYPVLFHNYSNANGMINVGSDKLMVSGNLSDQ